MAYTAAGLWFFFFSSKIECRLKMIFYLSDCSEIWPTKGGGTAFLDWGGDRNVYRRELPEGLKGWSHPLRVSPLCMCVCLRACFCWLWCYDSKLQRWQDSVTGQCLMAQIVFKCISLTCSHTCFPSFRMINKIRPGSVKKTNHSQLNWHKVIPVLS